MDGQAHQTSEDWLGRKHCEVDFYLTQMLTAHGYFRKFLHKIGKSNSPFSLYENDEHIDDSEHIFSVVPGGLEGDLTVDNIVTAMLNNERNWKVASLCCADRYGRCKTSSNKSRRLVAAVTIPK